MLFYTHLRYLGGFLGLCLGVLLLLGVRSQSLQPSFISLDSCIALAIAKNLDIQRGKLQVQSSQADQMASYLAMLPNVNGGLSYSSNLGRSIDPTTNLFINTNIQALTPSASSNVLLFQGLRVLNNIKKSKVDLEAQDAALAAQITVLTRQVVTQYLAVLLNQELVDNALYQLETAQQQMRRLERLVQAQTRPEVDLLDIEAQVADAQVRLIQNRNALGFSKLSLKQLLLLPYEQDIVLDTTMVADSDYSPIVEDVGLIYAQAVPLDPRITQAKLAYRSAHLAWRIAQSSYYPTLSFGVFMRSNYSSAARQLEAVGIRQIPNAGFVSGDPNQTITLLSPVIEALPQGSLGSEISRQFDENLTTSFSVTLSIPVFNRWTTRTQAKKSMLLRSQRRIDLEQANNTLRREVETAYNDALSAFGLYEAAQLKTQAADAAFRATEQRYELNTVSQVDYQISQNNSYQARSEAVNAKYRFLFRKKILEFYKGTPFN